MAQPVNLHNLEELDSNRRSSEPQQDALAALDRIEALLELGRLARAETKAIYDGLDDEQGAPRLRLAVAGLDIALAVGAMALELSPYDPGGHPGRLCWSPTIVIALAFVLARLLSIPRRAVAAFQVSLVAFVTLAGLG